MLRMLRETTGNLPAFDSFDQLVIPYRAVATDIIHLQEVVLDKGVFGGCHDGQHVSTRRVATL